MLVLLSSLDDPGFRRAIETMEQHLDGCRVFAEWWPEVVEHPFEENMTRIYARSDARQGSEGGAESDGDARAAGE